jgi:hypothetical protein
LAVCHRGVSAYYGIDWVLNRHGDYREPPVEPVVAGDVIIIPVVTPVIISIVVYPRISAGVIYKPLVPVKRHRIFMHMRVIIPHGLLNIKISIKWLVSSVRPDGVNQI